MEKFSRRTHTGKFETAHEVAGWNESGTFVKFTKISADARRINAGSAIIDGEVVVPSSDDTTDFSVLQNELKGRSTKIALIAFDLLYLNGGEKRPHYSWFVGRTEAKLVFRALPICAAPPPKQKHQCRDDEYQPRRSF